MRVHNKRELSIFDLLVSQNIEKQQRTKQQKVSERDTVEISCEVTVEFPTYHKMHDDPENYIHSRYFSPLCPWYAGDLTDEERSIGYRNEISMLKKGKLFSLQFGDSSFRGMPVFGLTADDAYMLFNRQMVDAQINNIFKANGIEVEKNSHYTFSIDPYTYYISIEGVDELTRQKMEAALNVGENGKNLYIHVLYYSFRDGADSSQYSFNGLKKNWIYHDVLKYTGMELNNLEERDGTYYTQDGIDICDLVKKGIDQSDEVKGDFKNTEKKLTVDEIHWLASIGRDNIRDLILHIDFINGGLVDKYQNIQYTTETYDIERLRKAYPYVTI